MRKLKLEGAYTAIATPFKKNGSIDFAAFRRLLNYQLEGGISGIVVCGSTGEAATLADQEYARIVKFAVKEIAGKIPVIAGAGSNNTLRAVALSRIAQRAGADGLLHVTPFYNKPTPTGLVAHYKAIARAVPLPIILYNVPSRTASNVLPATILRIAKEVPNLVAVKEASGNINQIGEIITGARNGFVVLSGDDSLTLPAMILGAKGCISVVANEVPGDFSNLCSAALRGDWKTARALHYKLLPLVNVNFIEPNPIPVKAALAMMGFIKENLRLPLVPLEKTNRPKLKGILRNLGLV